MPRFVVKIRVEGYVETVVERDTLDEAVSHVYDRVSTLSPREVFGAVLPMEHLTLTTDVGREIAPEEPLSLGRGTWWVKSGTLR